MTIQTDPIPSDALKRPLLLVITGLPATGKTTLAEYIASRWEAKHLNTDIVRIKMGLTGKYDEASRRSVYEQLMIDCRHYLAQGERVIVDGTFYKQVLRKEIEEIAAEANTPIYWIYLHAPDDIIRDRMQKARKYSEADFQVYERIQNNYQKLKGKVLKVDTAQVDLEGAYQGVLDFVLAGDGS